MKKYILAGAAALALALPAAAQDMAVTSDGDVVLTTDQRTMFDTWPPERRVVYEAWPVTYRQYFWTLTPEQQRGWWVLTDDQRARLYAMTPPQRTQAWTAIAAQMAGGTPSATTTATAARTGNIQWVSNGMVQNIPMDQATGEVPICAPDQQDNCINAWEAGKRGPNVTRPLSYWPGKPASDVK